MKRLFLLSSLSAILFLPITAPAQGLVNFMNTSSTLITVNDLLHPSGPISAPPGSYYFGLLVAPPGTTDPTAFTFTGLYATNLSISSAGRISGGLNVSVPGWAPGETRAFYIAGWSANVGHDFNPGFFWGGPVNGPWPDAFGASVIRNGAAGGFDGISNIPIFNVFGPPSGVPGFVLSNPPLPEPSALALTLAGAGLLYASRNRAGLKSIL